MQYRHDMKSHLRLAIRVGNTLLVGGEEERHVGRPVGEGNVVRVADGHVENVLHSAYHGCLRHGIRSWQEARQSRAIGDQRRSCCNVLD